MHGHKLQKPGSGRLILAIIGVFCGLRLIPGPMGLLAAPLSQPAGQGTLWVFAVGVSHYRNRMIDLQFADYDAQTLAATLNDRGKGLFKDVKMRVPVNDQVTKPEVDPEI